MKYFRLISNDPNYEPLVQFKIYPGYEFPSEWGDNVEFHAERYPMDWEESTEEEYLKEYTIEVNANDMNNVVLKRINELIDEYKLAKINLPKCSESFEYDNLDRRIHNLKYIFLEIGVYQFINET